MKKQLSYSLLTVLLVIMVFSLFSCIEDPVDPKECDHEFGDWYITVAGSCAKGGEARIEQRHCPICDSYEERTSYIRHNVVTTKGVEPSCTNGGWTEGSHCSTCGEVIKEQKYIDPIGHTEVFDGYVEPTCTTDGSTGTCYCSTCGEVLKPEETIPGGHTSVIDAAIEPTCTTTGLTEGSHCSVCDEVLVEQEVVPMIDHNIVVDQAVAPTCTATGLTEGSHCSVCNEVFVGQEVVPVIDHNIIVDQAVAPTCTATGLTEGSHCSDCQEVFIAQQILPIIEHIASEAVVENYVAPDCTNSGSYDSVVYCFVCNQELSSEAVSVDALGHNEVTDEAVAPTCTATGLSEGKHCAACDEVIVKQTTVKKLDHDYIDYICSICEKKLETTNPGNFEFNLLSDGTYSVKVKSNILLRGDVVIPNTYNGKPVTEIADQSFWINNEYITSITVPDSVTKIGTYAFSDCRALKTITFGKSSKLDYIGEKAFWACYELSSISIPESVTFIGSNAFTYCKKLTSISIPDISVYISDTAFVDSAYYKDANNWTDNVLYIGNHLIKANSDISGAYSIKVGTVTVASCAFSSCSNLTEVSLPDSLTYISDSAFEHCYNLENVDLPDSITHIGSNAFLNCARFTKITIPSTVNYVGYHAFYRCSNLKTVVIKDGATGCSYFEGCDITYATIPAWAIKCIPKASLYSVDITSGDSIDDNAFKNCTSLYKVTIGDSITSIGHSAFEGCSNLRNVAIGNRVTDIATDAFYGCQIHIARLPASAIAFIPKTHLMNVTITSGTAIADYAFRDCINLSYVSIPSSITTIGTNAFVGCKKITKINITDISAWCNITGSIPCEGYRNLYLNGDLITDLVIPDGITSIKDSAFSNFTNIISVTIPDSVTSIGESAFSGCTGITELTIPYGVTSVGEYAFYGCTCLATVTIPRGIDFIGEKAFYRCNLNSIVEGTGGYYSKYYVEDNCLIERSTNTLIVGTNNSFIPTDVVTVGDSAFSGRTKMTAITIPDSVTYIGDDAFSDCNSLTSVTIGNGVTLIGTWAFSNCDNLASIDIPDDVSVGNYAFYSCDSLTSIDIPAGVSVGNYAFSDCDSLTSAFISGDAICVGAGAFYSCDNLSGIYIGNGITSIEKETFYGCTSLLNVAIPNSVVNIHDAAFKNCTSLVSVEIRDSVAFVAEDAFSGCPITNATGPLVAILQIPQNLLESITITSGTYIDDYSFRGYPCLTNITIGDGVTTIGDCAFSSCKKLSNVVIPDSVTSIGDYAFRGCTSLTSIIIPNRVTSIGYEAFKDCDSLYIVYNHSNFVFTIGSSDYGYIAENAKILVSNGSTTYADDGYNYIITNDGFVFREKEDKYELIAYTGGEETIAFPTNINGSSYDLYHVRGVVNVIIPDNVTSINGSAFWGCDSLTSITIPNSVTSIGSYAFCGCTSLASIIIPDSVTSIGAQAFLGAACHNNKDNWENNVFYIGNHLIEANDFIDGGYTIKEGTTCIAESAFYGCDYLTSITIPNTVISIGRFAFCDCTGLTSVVIPDSVTSIGSYAFDGCNNITSVVIGDSVDSIGDCAFRDCSGLTSVVIPSSVTYIGPDAFKGCSNLKDVYIEDVESWLDIDGYDYGGVNSYGTLHVFDHKGNEITNLVIPDNITSIPRYAFQNAKNITSVTISDRVASIGNHAFSGCYNLKDVYIEDVESWLNIETDNYGYATNYGTLHILDNEGNEITDIVIPESITSIPGAAFENAKNITSITIPDSVTSIGDRAFYNTVYYNKLWNILYIGNHLIDAKNIISGKIIIKEGTITIADGAFENCSNLTNVVIPDSVISIGDRAFYDCYNLTSITIPDSVTFIGKDAFDNTACYNNENNWEDGVLYIGNHLIEAKKDISGEYVIKDDTVAIAYYAFSSCSRLTSVVIPCSVTFIGDVAFYYCTNLTSVVIPDSVTEIGDFAFSGCHRLTNAAIGNSITSIGSYAFSGCDSLNSVVIPDSVTSIDSYAFYGCERLTDVYYIGTEEEWAEIGIGSDNSYLNNATIHYNYVPEE